VAILVVVAPSRRRERSWPLRAAAAVAVLLAVVTGCGRAQSREHEPDRLVVGGTRGAVEHVTENGSSFGTFGDYSVYLPPGYGRDPDRRYPVVYLLHGGSDSDSLFLDLGIRQAMDDGVASGEVEPMILVFPDGGPKFAGDGNASRSFDDYFAAELVPAVDRRWHTVADRTGRAIGGVSLGGRHALQIAGRQHSLVAAAGGHSTTVTRSPEQMAAPLVAARIPVYLDVGTSDGLLPIDQALADALRRQGADVCWNPAEGGHTKSYWAAHLPDYLRFYSDALAADDG
jgi:enterochelin esterase-like enzyme